MQMRDLYIRMINLVAGYWFAGDLDARVNEAFVETRMGAFSPLGETEQLLRAKKFSKEKQSRKFPSKFKILVKYPKISATFFQHLSNIFAKLH